MEPISGVDQIVAAGSVPGGAGATGEDLGAIRGIHRGALILVATFVIVASGVVIPRLRDTSSGAGLHRGDAAPPFTLPSFDGRMISLADYRGQPVVLNFWASWCVPCRTEAPILRDAAVRDGSQVTFIGINFRDQENDARAFLTEFGIPYLNLRDVDGAVEQRYRSPGIPFSVFIARDGTIARIWIGPIDDAHLRTYLAEIQ